MADSARRCECPTCGSPVVVAVGDEGTNHYIPANTSDQTMDRTLAVSIDGHSGGDPYPNRTGTSEMSDLERERRARGLEQLDTARLQAEVDLLRAEVERLRDLAATATRAHTRAIHALVGNCEYPEDERAEIGDYLTKELQR